MQHALPITFGFKATLWLSPILNHLENLKSIQKNGLYLQFGGAVGTLASLDANAIKTKEALGKELGLNDPDISWHSSREKLVDIMHRLTAIAGTLGKIGKDINLMSQTEIGEVFEQKIKGRGISSTMPQKRNPIAAQGLMVSAKTVANYMNLLYQELSHDHERSSGNWQTEWMTVPNLIIHAAGGIGVAQELLTHLEVNSEKMHENLMKTNGFVMAEAVMMQLAKKIGKQQAHAAVHKVIEQAQIEHKTFQEALEQHELLKEYLKETISEWLNPKNYLGSIEPMIGAVLKKANVVIKNKKFN